MISSLNDILARLDSNSEDSLTFFRSIYSESPIGIELYDEKGVLVDVNRACLDIFGVSDVSEVVGFSLFQDPNVTDEVKTKLSSGETVRYEIPFDFEKVKAKRLYQTTKSGISYLDVLITPIRVDGEGTLNGYMVHVQDISDRKQADEDLIKARDDLELKVEQRTAELAESWAKWRSLVETVPDIIFTTDRVGKILFINHAPEGLSPEEAIGTKACDYVPEEHRGSVWQALEQVFQARKSVSYEIAARGPRDSLAWYMTRVSPLLDGDNVVSALFVTRDITERKLAEEHKLESLEVLAGGIAHDFNNALTAILNNITVARMTATPGDKLFNLLSAAERASLSARNLTRQLLTFSKGGDPVRKSLVLQDFLEETTRFALTGSKVVAEFTIAEDLWPVEADEGQLTQVMNNLVLNAAQAMPEGGTITVGAENVTVWKDSAMQLKEGRYVKLTVRDRGPGIPIENLRRIFDPYFTTKEDGSGLGLAISYSIVKKHGGRLSVDSETGSGTVFSVYLPASEEEPVEQESLDEAPPERKGRILLLEDDAMIAESLALALGEFGYTVEHVQDGGEAALLYQKAHESGAPFDLVIMDLTVPGGLGGRDTLKLLREINPDVRAIATSGYSNDPVMSNYVEYGFAGVITKPYLVEELVDMLKITSP